MTTSRAPFPQQCFHIHTLLESGDDVMVSWTWTGTHLGDLPGFPASGRKFTLRA
jgi:predicted ester cyclase